MAMHSGDIGHWQKRQPIHHAAEVADVGVVTVHPYQSQVMDLAPCDLAEVKKHPGTAMYWPSVVRTAFIAAISKSQTTVFGSVLMPVRLHTVVRRASLRRAPLMTYSCSAVSSDRPVVGVVVDQTGPPGELTPQL